jgi:hypothetical protein
MICAFYVYTHKHTHTQVVAKEFNRLITNEVMPRQFIATYDSLCILFKPTRDTAEKSMIKCLKQLDKNHPQFNLYCLCAAVLSGIDGLSFGVKKKKTTGYVYV